MPVVDIEKRATRDLGWHNCSAFGGHCLACQVEQALGGSVWDSLLTFIAYSESGSELCLKRSNCGFSGDIKRSIRQ